MKITWRPGYENLIYLVSSDNGTQIGEVGRMVGSCNRPINIWYFLAIDGTQKRAKSAKAALASLLKHSGLST